MPATSARLSSLTLLAAMTLAGCGVTGPGLPAAPLPGSEAAAATSDRRPAAPASVGQYAGEAATDMRVITYNTAGGNSRIKTPQADFLKLPFYQDVIQGKPGAPILCLQEVGRSQFLAARKLAETSKNFQVRAVQVGYTHFMYNMVVVPRRYAIERYDTGRFPLAQIKNAIPTVWDVATGDRPLNDLPQIIEPRAYQLLRLRDTRAEKRFTLVNTHLSIAEGIRPDQARKLMAAANGAAKEGPVIVAGDLNTHTEKTESTARDVAAADRAIRGMLAGWTDLGAAGQPGARADIDWILGKGVVHMASRWYTEPYAELPGAPAARVVSDHIAEEAQLRFE